MVSIIHTGLPLALKDALETAGQSQLILQTERLLLRPFVIEDVDAIYDYARDEEVAQYTTFHAHKSIQDSYDFLEHIVIPSYHAGNFGPLAIEERETGHMIGSVELRCNSSPIRTHTLEAGVVLNKKAWKKGYMREAMSALCDYAFSSSPIFRIFACVEEHNSQTMRFAEAFGLIYEGRERSGRFFDETYQDLLHYSILKPEWSYTGSGYAILQEAQQMELHNKNHPS